MYFKNFFQKKLIIRVLMKNDREQSLNLITNALRSEVKLKLYAERKDGGEHELLTHFHKKPHYCLLK